MAQKSKQSRRKGGATKSTKPLRERKRLAWMMFTEGRSHAAIAADLEISEETVRRYRRKYEDELSERAQANPDLLQKFLENTVRMLAENELVRSEAWDSYRIATHPASQARFLDIALKAQKERAGLFGVLGVKAEFFAHVQQVRVFQEKLIEFLQRELCLEDRGKLSVWLENELGRPEALPGIPTEMLELTG